MKKSLPRCLTIAGSDSGGGAGIQGDLKTFTVLGAYGMTAITALTAQNTLGVSAIHVPPSSFVKEQIKAVLDDIGCDAAKTGMLANAEIVEAVAETLSSYSPMPLVVDPVMVSTSGARLLTEDAIDSLVIKLLPLATLITPNVFEAEILSGITISDHNRAVEAAHKILGLGVHAVLVKGGDATYSADTVYDIFATHEKTWVYEETRIKTSHTHGSGCALSSAICVGLARGLSLQNAVEFGRAFIRRSLQQAQALGHGSGPVNHLAGKEPTSQNDY